MCAHPAQGLRFDPPCCKKTETTCEKGNWLNILRGSELHGHRLLWREAFLVCTEGALIHDCNNKSCGRGLTPCQLSRVTVLSHLLRPVTCLVTVPGHTTVPGLSFKLGSRALIHSESGLLLPWYLRHYRTSGNVFSDQVLLLFSSWLKQRPLLAKIQRTRDCRHVQP